MLTFLLREFSFGICFRLCFFDFPFVFYFLKPKRETCGIPSLQWMDHPNHSGCTISVTRIIIIIMFIVIIHIIPIIAVIRTIITVLISVLIACSTLLVVLLPLLCTQVTVTACENEQGAGKYVSKEGRGPIAVFLAVRSRRSSVPFFTYFQGPEAPSAAYLRLAPFPILTQSYPQPSTP